MQRLRIVLGSACLARYPEGGGHWSAFQQYLFGLRALGHDVFWLEVLPRRNAAREERWLRIFRERMDAWGFAGSWAVLQPDGTVPQDFETIEIHGVSAARLRTVVEDADVLWNFACMLRSPLLERFKRRALIDLDPGILHVSALDVDLDLAAHHVHFTAGLHVGQEDCDVPELGFTWRTFRPVVHVPLWEVAPPSPEGTFTSVTQWGWGELHLNGRVLSVSKRDAYMSYVDVPRRAGQTFELAANLDPSDPTGDLPRLAAGGWRVVDPVAVAGDPATYRNYIARSRGEFCCPKAIYRDLRTGWFSDRSVAFLAAGRPVLMEDTGIANHIPVGAGVLVFSDVASATEAARTVEADYASHARAARALAVEHFAADKVLPRMLEQCA